jgi:iron complex outermembrane recepter protein
MKRTSALLLFLFLGMLANAQQTVSGTVRDAVTGEGLVNAVVLVDNGKTHTVCDIEGRYQLKLENGEYLLSVRYVGYTADSVKIRVAGKPLTVDFNCNGTTMKEVQVVSDIAIDRKTPVAFYNIGEVRIREETGGRDMTLLLNSTPGAYATEQGGGIGDSRVNIRGVDQRNVAVMVDGVPVNDMENGQVYWSNWAGLSDVTRTMQVQRGLGASRLAIPSVGGTINILTRGIDDKPGYWLSTDFGNNNMRKVMFGFNSGEFGKGWGITLAGARRTDEGWVDQTWNDQWSYFLKVQKRFDKHLISFSVNGAPQSHGQRYDRMPIAVINKEYARELIAKDHDGASDASLDSLVNANLVTNNFTTMTQGERGQRYNPNWGFINYAEGQGRLNQDINFFHKPLFNVSWFWTPSEKFTFSTIAYLSIGYGGGTNFNSSVSRDTTTGQLLLTNAYNSNSTQIDQLYSPTEHKSTRVLLASMNNHNWVGALSTATWRPTNKVTLLFGIDARHYKGSHYRMVYDLMGGDYYVDGSNKNQPNGIGTQQYAMKREGDKVGFYNDSYVDWGGAFAQAEYSGDRWSTFLTLTGSLTQYQRIDHFKKRDIVLEDGTVVPMIVGYNEVYYTNGTDEAVAQNNAILSYYNNALVIDNPTGPNDTIEGATAYAWSSEYARTAETVKKRFPGFTVKTGANYNFTEHYNGFINVGYMNMAPRFNSVFDNNNKVYPGIKQQYIYSAEIGAGARYRMFAANMNMYYTNWRNKPQSGSPTTSVAGDPYTYDLTGLSTVLYGVEFDFTWRVHKKVEIEGIASFGEWRYDAAGTVYLYDANYVLERSVEYSARNVHMGDAAQTQLGGSVRFEPIKGLYIKPRYTYFARNYANFDPIILVPVYDVNNNQVADFRDHESWMMPAYGLLDIYAGYEFKEIVSKEKNKAVRISFNLTLTNALNTFYISDASYNAQDVGFTAEKQLVFVGLGRRWTAGMRIAF